MNMTMNWEEYFNQIDIKELTNILSIGKKIQTENIIKNQHQQFKTNDEFYTGKTFYDELEHTYYKVVSGFSDNRFRLTCLIFPEYPFYEYEDIQRGSEICTYWGLSSIELDNMLIANLGEMKEISLEEWEEAFDKHVEILKRLKAVKEVKNESKKN